MRSSKAIIQTHLIEGGLVTKFNALNSDQIEEFYESFQEYMIVKHEQLSAFMHIT